MLAVFGSTMVFIYCFQIFYEIFLLNFQFKWLIQRLENFLTVKLTVIKNYYKKPDSQEIF